jgi:tetratricopeptide (TPR) repeat protein
MKTGIRVLSLVAALSMMVGAADTPEQLIKAGHWKRARPLIEAAYAKSPKDPHAVVLMAKMKKTLGDLDGARKLLEQALAQDPNNFEAHFEMANVLGDQASKASMFKQMSLAGALKHEIETAVRLNPADVDAHWGMMQYYLQAPGIAGGSKDKAREEIAAISKIGPAWGYLAQAEFDNHEKQTGNIEDLYRKARAADPQNYNAIVSQCNLLLNAKRWDEAEKCGADLVKLDRGRVSGYSVLAIAYSSEQKWNELDGVIADGEKNVPDNLQPYFTAGRTLAQSGADNARGERYLRHYLEQEPEPTGAKPAFAHWRLGQILEKQGRKGDAVAEYQKAAQMAPDNEPIQKDLKRLK